jgi:8-oxo-dGTP pyrophosphatase MutT (NUDIX family)
VNAITLDAVRRKLAGRSPVHVVDPSAGQAAVAIVLVSEPNGPEALFIERATRAGDPWSGQVAFPGGRRDGSDPSLLVTAIRETREEVGVDLSDAELLGELDDVHPRTRTLPALIVRPFVFGLSRKPAVRYSVEVASHRWVRLGDLLVAGVYGDVEIQPVGRAFPAYRAGGYVVWGLTERIITAFLQLAASEPAGG